MVKKGTMMTATVETAVNTPVAFSCIRNYPNYPLFYLCHPNRKK